MNKLLFIGKGRGISAVQCRTKKHTNAFQDSFQDSLQRKIHSEPLVDPIKIETRGRVMLIMLNRPSRRNAVNRFMAEQLYSTMKAFESLDPATISSAVLCSTSNNFCSGYDLHDVANQGLEDALDLLKTLKADQSPMGPCRLQWTKPVIAAVEGACVAGGLELALCADLRVGTTDSYYGMFNRRFGVPLVDGGTVRLPRVVGHGRAMDMILTGRRVEAEEAERMGLINRLVEPGTAIDAAVKLANEITSHPTIPMLSDRKSVYENISAGSFNDQMNNEVKNGIASVSRQKLKPLS